MVYEGIFPVVPTLLNDDEQIDHEGLKHLIDYYISCRCQGLVVLGSGGEFPYFTLEEKRAIIATSASVCAGRIPLVAGCGFYSLQETIAFIRACQGLTLDGLLVALPTYYPLKYEDVFAYYREICRSAPCPVLYYHFPQMTGLFFTPEQLGRILMIEGIAGMKVSAFCLREMKSLLAQVRGKPFSLFAGVSFLLRDTLAMGGQGVIDPIASFAPRLVLDAFRACRDGQAQKAHILQEQILDLIPIMNSLYLPALIQKRAFQALSHLRRPSRGAGTVSRHALTKETLRQLGHPISARVRSPLPQITARERSRIAAIIAGNTDLQNESYR
ncbi:MAG: dihydrodipicolinate synthase family protein [Syntrophaceae bacterium]